VSTADYDILIDWNDDGDFSDTGEDVTSRVMRSGGPVKFAYGRDQARSLGAIRAGETAFHVNNESKDYSPDNASSPLFGNLRPGRPVLIQATFNSTTYELFRGFLDGYELRPRGSGASTVEFTALDLLHRLGQAKLSTALHDSLQTGEAIHVLLDEIGWPEDQRDIDQGATTLRWWWEEGNDGFTALKRIVDSEGPPAFAFVGSNGTFVFRDRHHRFLSTASTTVQATFRASGTEPLFSEPLGYNVGWRDLINQVVIEVEEREAQPVQSVWSTTSEYVLAAGETLTLDLKPNDPFIGAINPVVGTDIILRSGSGPTVNITRNSGQSTQLTITAANATIVQSIRLRAQPVPIVRKVRVVAENPESINKHGVRSDVEITPVWANVHDALAIGKIIVAQRGERLPVVSIAVNNATDARLTQILSRDLSDRIHIIEPNETGLDDDFFIEKIEHEISEVGKKHVATFSCERVWHDTTVTPNYFTFDKAGSGFNDGVFGEDGMIQSDKIFILGNTGDNGKLDIAGLGF
jgi:hypothetical protein